MQEVAQLLDPKDVAQLLRVKQRHFDEVLRKQTDFPKPLKIGPRTNRWYMSDIKDYLKTRRAI